MWSVPHCAYTRHTYARTHMSRTSIQYMYTCVLSVVLLYIRTCHICTYVQYMYTCVLSVLLSVEAQEQVLTGQEDIMLLHKTIATEHATLAYKEG